MGSVSIDKEFEGLRRTDYEYRVMHWKNHWCQAISCRVIAFTKGSALPLTGCQPTRRKALFNEGQNVEKLLAYWILRFVEMMGSHP
jgi:hypothetical protein